MSKRLPMPSYLGDPFAPCPANGGLSVAEAWARWAAKRDGMTIPPESNHFTIQEVERGVSYVGQFQHETSRTGRVWQGRRYEYPVTRDYETLAEVPMPAHAIAMPRCDLWHLARQGGGTPEQCVGAGEASWDLRFTAEETKPAKATGREAQLFALLDAPAQFVGLIQAAEERTRLRRIENEERNRLYDIKRVQDDRASYLLKEGEGGEGAYDIRSSCLNTLISVERRAKWLRLARDAKACGFGPEDIAFCVDRAKLFHRHARWAKFQFILDPPLPPLPIKSATRRSLGASGRKRRFSRVATRMAMAN